MHILIFFVLGVCLGSFANVIIYRLYNKEKGIFLGRSKCPRCDTVLSIIDLIPILSFFLLKGRCRTCKKRISYNYLIGELLMGGMFSIAAYCNPVSIKLFFLLFITFILITVALYDIRYQEIPNIIVIPSIIIIFVFSWIDPFRILSSGKILFGIKSSFLYSFFGLLVPVSFFGLQRLISKGRWVGGGDLKLGGLMGALLGIKLVVISLFFAYLSGTIYILITSLFKKIYLKKKIPFGPFLSIGTFIALYYGETLFSWYLSLLV